MSTALSILSWIYSQISKFFSTLMKVIALCISGLAVGWLMGLSIAPTVQHVITSVLALVVGIMSVLAGISVMKSKDTPQKDETDPAKSTDGKPDGATQTELTDNSQKLTDQSSLATTGNSLTESARTIAVDSLWPVAGFMAGLMLGSTAGLLARTNQLFGPNPKLLALRWDLDSTQQKLLTERLLVKNYGLQLVEKKVLGAKKYGTKNFSVNPKKSPTAPRKPCTRSTKNETAKEQIVQEEKIIPLSKEEIAVFFGSKSAEFCVRTGAQRSEELKAELSDFVEEQLADNTVTEKEKKLLLNWQEILKKPSMDQLKEIRKQLCEIK